MYKNMTLEQLKDELATINRQIEELRSYGASWALDSRKMRILESCQLQVWSEILKKQLTPSL